jgi:hypothetical protein
LGTDAGGYSPRDFLGYVTAEKKIDLSMERIFFLMDL